MENTLAENMASTLLSKASKKAVLKVIDSYVGKGKIIGVSDHDSHNKIIVMFVDGSILMHDPDTKVAGSNIAVVNPSVLMAILDHYTPFTGLLEPEVIKPQTIQ